MNDSVVVLWNLWVAPKSRLDHDGNQQRCAVCGCSMLDRLTVLSILFVLTYRFVRLLNCSPDISYSTGLYHCCDDMFAPIARHFINFFVISSLFIAPVMAWTWPAIVTTKPHSAAQLWSTFTGITARSSPTRPSCGSSLPASSTSIPHRDVIHYLYVYTRGNPNHHWPPCRVCK